MMARAYACIVLCVLVAASRGEDGSEDTTVIISSEDARHHECHADARCGSASTCW